MKITVVGLGLIGGSLCKHIKKHTNHTVGGIDINQETLKMALSQGAIDMIDKDVSSADITIVSLFPNTCIKYCLENADIFKKNSVVFDVCGVKKTIVDAVEEPLMKKGVNFVGVHPMAGREFSGFEYSQDNLFDNASFIMTPTEKTSQTIINLLEDFAYSINFKNVVKSTTEEHDSIIAFTSQLAHVVSNAYIKSPTHLRQAGFSAGSFLDLTRVAKLNEDMWTPLFLMNSEALGFELDYIIDRLTEYRDAIKNFDADTLHQLLKDGRILKESTHSLYSK